MTSAGSGRATALGRCERRHRIVAQGPRRLIVCQPRREIRKKNFWPPAFCMNALFCSVGAWALVFSVFLGDWSCEGLSYCQERGRFGLAREPRLLRILRASILLVGVRASVPARAAISLSRNSSGASRSLSRSARGMASFVAQLYFVLGRSSTPGAAADAWFLRLGCGSGAGGMC